MEAALILTFIAFVVTAAVHLRREVRARRNRAALVDAETERRAATWSAPRNWIPSRKSGAAPPDRSSEASPAGPPVAAHLRDERGSGAATGRGSGPAPVSPVRPVPRPPNIRHAPARSETGDLLAADAPPPLPAAKGAPASLLRSVREWVAPGRTLTIASREIAGGMLYVGRDLDAVSPGGGSEPALIVPTLRVDWTRPDHTGLGLGYWPSYRDIPPACRAAYLNWLAGGRREPNANIGYVFLFFYGLERRLLADGLLRAGGEERDLVEAEIERLLVVYGTNGSFNGYASRLLGLVRLFAAWDGVEDTVPPTDAARLDAADVFRVRAAVGKLIAARRPLPADWALAWLLHEPEVRLRTPAVRCAAGFAEIFRLRYERSFGHGLLVEPGRTRLQLGYQPASASFAGAMMISPPDGGVPDVSAFRGPLGKLADLAEECTTALDPYSRWLGRNPDVPPGLAAAALLPPELISASRPGPARGLGEWLERRCGVDREELADADGLLRIWSGAGAGKLAKGDCVALAQLVDKLGFGFEPDSRFGGPVLAPGIRIALFRQPEEPRGAVSSHYAAAAILLHLAAAVAAADGSIGPEEERHLAEHLEEALHLEAPERVRLTAHLRWLIDTKPSLAGLKRRLAAVAPAQKRAFAEFLVGVAGADGRIEPGEVDALRKIYPLLGLAPDDVYRDLHTLGGRSPTPVPAEEPVTVQNGRAAGATWAVPPPPPASAAGMVLDMARVEAKLRETAAVSALLGSVFAEDEPERPQPAPEVAAAENRPATHPIAGLDAAHTTFLVRLAAKDLWPRGQIEVLAAELGLLTDGALETINEIGFDHAGEPLLEGDDPVELNRDVYQELVA